MQLTDCHTGPGLGVSPILLGKICQCISFNALMVTYNHIACFQFPDKIRILVTINQIDSFTNHTITHIFISHSMSLLNIYYYKWRILSYYVIVLLLSYPIRQRKGGVHMLTIVTALIISVVADVISHLICKWLDSNGNDN